VHATMPNVDLRWWRRRQPATPEDLPRRVLFSWTPGPFLPGGTYVGPTATLGKVNRADAMTVPGVLKGRNLICSIAALPLEQRDAEQNRVRSSLLDQIDPNVPNVVTLAMTVEDLIFDSGSWWQVLSRFADGFPATARHLDSDAVSMFPPSGYPLSTLPSGMFPNGVAWVMGKAVDKGDLLRFDSPNPPLAVHGARAIRRAMKLAQAGEMYADDPEARAYWRPVEGVDPGDDDDIEGWMADYAEARRSGSEAYIPAALERVPISPQTPADLQLVDLQRRSDLEISNLMGLDPEDLGVSTTSRTYQNNTDRWQDRLNNTLLMYIRALTDRLSMNDVTRRGYRVVANTDSYLRADPATRWDTYGVAIDKEIKTVAEIRVEEGLPAIPVESRPVLPVPSAAPLPLRFESHAGMTFDFDDGQDFAVSAERRTVTGLLMPYNVVGRNVMGRWRFAVDSISWKPSAVSRVKLNRDHSRGSLLGVAQRIEGSASGVRATFKVARGAEGDAALSLAEDQALDGLSGEVDVLEYDADPDNPGVFLVTKARLVGAALTGYPGFDDARVTRVAASRHTEGPAAMPDEPRHVQLEGAAELTASLNAAVAAFSASSTAQGEQLTTAVEAITGATTTFAAAVEAINNTVPQPIGPTVVRPGEGVISEPLVYSLTGVGHSFVRDSWDARHAPYGSGKAEEAMARLRKYGEQTEVFAEQAVQRFANAGNTTDQAEIIPPGYRPDLYVGQVPQGRPLWDSVGTRVALTNATPFKVPVWVGSANLSGTNSEGTGPSTGTITDHTYRTVSPTAQSGEFVVTRELMDSSNPVIDLIALNAMREEYSQDTEAVIAAAIAAATDNDTGSGQSTEGCYVYTVTGAGSDLAIEGIRLMEAEFSAHRFLAPDRLLAGPTGFSGLCRAVDDVGRPLFPFVGAQNALGTVGRAAQALAIDGIACPNAWSMTSTYDDVLLFNSVDVLAGESPLLTFRFEEKGGPENIYLNIWGYFCFQILRYTGIHACNWTEA
jgi:hypothetical protein